MLVPSLNVPSILLTVLSCTKDYGTVEITYQEASPIYGDVNAKRAQPLNETVRAINSPGKIFFGEYIILIGVEQEGVHVIDNTNPNNTATVNFINIKGSIEFFVKDNFIYAETYMMS